MEEYFYLDANQQQKGPIAPSDFMRTGITKDTLIWKNGMAGWQAAGNIPELSSYFHTTPPPPPVSGPAQSYHQSPVQPQGQRPDNLLIWSILTTVLCCLPLGIVAIVYSTKVDSLWNNGDYDGAMNAAKNAKLFCLLSLGGGVLAFIFAFFFGLLGSLGSL